MDKIISLVLAALVAILSALGILTAGEGVDLTTYGTATATGIIGLVQLVRAVIARRKGESGTTEEQ